MYISPIHTRTQLTVFHQSLLMGFVGVAYNQECQIFSEHHLVWLIFKGDLYLKKYNAKNMAISDTQFKINC